MTTEPQLSRSTKHKEKQNKQKTIKNKAKYKIRPVAAAIILLLALLAGLMTGYQFVSNKQANIDISSLPQDQQQQAKDDMEYRNINILLLGIDEREQGEAARADVIIVATLRPDTKEVSMLSIPRDTRVDIQGRKYKEKINHAQAYGGVALMETTVENLLDLDIDHTVKINFDGFINVIDALGGITINVESRMYKPLENIDLYPGQQTLMGYDALAYVRWRDSTGDIGRIQRQQAFIAAVTEKVKDMSLKKALSITSAIIESVETDMSIATMTKYGTKFLGIGPEDITTYSLPGEAVYIGGVSYVEPYANQLKQIVEYMKYGEPKQQTQQQDQDSQPSQQ